MTVNAAAMKKAAGSGHATATDLADWLVRTLGLPFREAHHVTGRAVALAEEKKVSLERLSLEDLQSINPGITADIFSVLAVQNSVKSRTSFGGTAPSEVQEADPQLEKAHRQGLMPGCNAPKTRLKAAAWQTVSDGWIDDRKQDFGDADAAGGDGRRTPAAARPVSTRPMKPPSRPARTPRRPSSRCRRSRKNRSRTRSSSSTR